MSYPTLLSRTSRTHASTQILSYLTLLIQVRIAFLPTPSTASTPGQQIASFDQRLPMRQHVPLSCFLSTSAAYSTVEFWIYCTPVPVSRLALFQRTFASPRPHEPFKAYDLSAALTMSPSQVPSCHSRHFAYTKRSKSDHHLSSNDFTPSLQYQKPELLTRVNFKVFIHK